MVVPESENACYTLDLERLRLAANEMSADRLMAATTETMAMATGATRPVDRATLFYLAAFYLARLADEALALGP